MREFKAKPKKWGSSIGITIPKEIVEAEGITPSKKITILVIGRTKSMKEIFGSLKRWKKPTQRIMEEIDEGYD